MEVSQEGRKRTDRRKEGGSKCHVIKEKTPRMRGTGRKTDKERKKGWEKKEEYKKRRQSSKNGPEKLKSFSYQSHCREKFNSSFFFFFMTLCVDILDKLTSTEML